MDPASVPVQVLFGSSSQSSYITDKLQLSFSSNQLK